ncbi:MAG: hypothetical protein ABIG93_04290 [archaeon]|nr:hypothetical protein [Nanoarchaeota archaeon]
MGSLGGYVFQLSGDELGFKVELDSKVISIKHVDDKILAVTSNECVELDYQGHVLERTPTPTNAHLSAIDEEATHLAFFDGSLYHLQNSVFTKAKQFSRAVLNIVKDLKFSYLSFGLNDNDPEFMVTDPEFNPIDMVGARYEAQVRAKIISEGNVLVNSGNQLDLYNGISNVRQSVCREITDESDNISGIHKPHFHEDFAMITSGRNIFSIDDDLNVRDKRGFGGLITCLG